jgi:hypothetical protein
MSAPESIAACASCLRKHRRSARRLVVVAARRALVRVDRDDDEIRVLLCRADAAMDLREVLGVHDVVIGQALGLPIARAEESSLGRNLSARLAVQRTLQPGERLERVGGTLTTCVRCNALSPDRPGVAPKGGSDSLVGRNVDAIETSATRPALLSKYCGARASPCVSPTPAWTMPASSSQWLVSRMPSGPQSMTWLFARATSAKPIALRSRATGGNAALVQSPSHEYGAPLNVRGSKIVVSRLPNVTSARCSRSMTALNGRQPLRVLG